MQHYSILNSTTQRHIQTLDLPSTQLYNLSISISRITIKTIFLETPYKKVIIQCDPTYLMHESLDSLSIGELAMHVGRVFTFKPQHAHAISFGDGSCCGAHFTSLVHLSISISRALKSRCSWARAE